MLLLLSLERLRFSIGGLGQRYFIIFWYYNSKTFISQRLNRRPTGEPLSEAVFLNDDGECCASTDQNG
jgi:hypothetical protein